MPLRLKSLVLSLVGTAVLVAALHAVTARVLESSFLELETVRLTNLVRNETADSAS